MNKKRIVFILLGVFAISVLLAAISVMFSYRDNNTGVIPRVAALPPTWTCTDTDGSGGGLPRLYDNPWTKGTIHLWHWYNGQKQDAGTYTDFCDSALNCGFGLDNSTTTRCLHEYYCNTDTGEGRESLYDCTFYGMICYQGACVYSPPS